MAVFTAVTDSQLTDWLQHYELGEAVDFRGIASGIENSNFFLTTTRGEYVLTIFENLTATQLPFYLDLMRHLASHAVPVPDPMPRRDGALFGMLNGKPAAIVTKLDGAPELTPGPLHCIEVGQMLARLHLAGRDFPAYQPNLRSLAWWQENVPAVLSHLSDAQRTLVTSELAHQAAFLHRKSIGPCQKAHAIATCSATMCCSRIRRRMKRGSAGSSTSISPATTNGSSMSPCA